MSAANRATKIAKLQKVLKKHFTPVKPSENRTVFENVLFACCLENATFEQAEEAFARLQQVYFDWNEVRVTTVPELAESMSSVADPTANATLVKKVLHSMFETHYSFDIEELKKENLGKAVDKISSYKGVTPFVVSYVAQSSLGGHSIPLAAAEMQIFDALELVSDKERSKRTVPGLERAIPKAKGGEFFSTLHQLAVQLWTSPNSTKAWGVMHEVEAGVKSRYQKKVKAEEEAAEEQAAVRAAKKKAARKKEAAAKEAAKAANPKAKAAKKKAAPAKPAKKATKRKPR